MQEKPVQDQVKEIDFMLRNLYKWGTGCGICIRGDDLVIVAVRSRASGVQVVGKILIESYRDRAPQEWGVEYASFLQGLGWKNIPATLCLPRQEVIFRTLQMPAMNRNELDAAINLQLHTLHPYENIPVYHATALTDSQPTTTGQVQVAVLIAEAARIDDYVERFAQAGIHMASCVTSATTWYTAVRFKQKETPRPFLVGDIHNSSLELYGETPGTSAWSSTLDLGSITLPNALQLVYEDLQLPFGETANLVLTGDTQEMGTQAGFNPIPAEALLPVPVQSTGEFELKRDASVFATALVSACPRTGSGLNLLPPRMRHSNPLQVHISTLALTVLLTVLGIGALIQQHIKDSSYVKQLQLETARLEQEVRTAATSQPGTTGLRERVDALVQMQARTESDLRLIGNLSRILPKSVWLNSLKLDDQNVVMTGTAENAAPLLAVLNASPLLNNARFVRSPVRNELGDQFEVLIQRQVPAP